MEVRFFENHAARIEGKGFTILNEFVHFEINGGDRLELSAPASMPGRTIAECLTTAEKSFTAQNPTL